MGKIRNLKLKIGVGLALASSLAIGAWAAGSLGTLPILGGASYCASYIGAPAGTQANSTITGTGGGTAASGGAVCGQTVPAGPSWFTGGEGTNIDIYTPGQGPIFAGGALTAFLPLPPNVNLGGLVVQTTGASVTIANSTGTQVFSGVGATEAVTLPAAPVQNQVVRLVNATSTAISTFSVAANTGQSLVQVAPTALAAQTNNAAAAALSTVAYIYQASNLTWYRIQ